MKRLKKAILILSAAWLLALAATTNAAAAEATGAANATVTAVGFAELALPAERFALQMELSDYGRTIEQATEANDARLARLREQIAPFGAVSECAFYSQEGYSGSRICVTRCVRLEGTVDALTPELYARLHACGVSALCEPMLFASPAVLDEAQAQVLQAALSNALSHAAALGGGDTVLEIEEQCGFCNGFARSGEGNLTTSCIGASVRVTVKKA